MELNKTLESLEYCWSRDDVLLKIKRGIDTDTIVNEFLNKNKKDIDTLRKVFNQRDKELLTQIEELSNCEAKLLNKINNFNIKKVSIEQKTKRKNISFKDKLSVFKLSTFMMQWSNKFVVITLLTISAIALSKQAWA